MYASRTYIQQNNCTIDYYHLRKSERAKRDTEPCRTIRPKWIYTLCTVLSTHPPASDLCPETCSFRWLQKLISFYCTLDHLLSSESALPYYQDTMCTTLCSTKLSTIHLANYEHLLGGLSRSRQVFPSLPNADWRQTAEYDNTDRYTSTLEENTHLTQRKEIIYIYVARFVDTWVKTFLPRRYLCLTLVPRRKSRYA